MVAFIVIRKVTQIESISRDGTRTVTSKTPSLITTHNKTCLSGLDCKYFHTKPPVTINGRQGFLGYLKEPDVQCNVARNKRSKMQRVVTLIVFHYSTSGSTLSTGWCSLFCQHYFAGERFNRWIALSTLRTTEARNLRAMPKGRRKLQPRNWT